MWVAGIDVASRVGGVASRVGGDEAVAGVGDTTLIFINENHADAMPNFHRGISMILSKGRLCCYNGFLFAHTALVSASSLLCNMISLCQRKYKVAPTTSTRSNDAVTVVNGLLQHTTPTTSPSFTPPMPPADRTTPAQPNPPKIVICRSKQAATWQFQQEAVPVVLAKIGQYKFN